MIPAFFDELRYDVSHLTVHCPRLTYIYGFHQCFIGLSHQEFTRLRYFSNQVGLIQISMHTLLVNSNVEVDDISVLERTTVGYTMADDFIDRGTQ